MWDLEATFCSLLP